MKIDLKEERVEVSARTRENTKFYDSLRFD